MRLMSDNSDTTTYLIILMLLLLLLTMVMLLMLFSLQVDSGEKHANPAEAQSGVILAIALGLCVTALLLVLVGCKLRLVRRLGHAL